MRQTACKQPGKNESAELHGFGYALPCLDLTMPIVMLQKFGKTFQERLRTFPWVSTVGQQVNLGCDAVQEATSSNKVAWI